MALLDECIQALGDQATVLHDAESTSISDRMVDMFPVTRWARIDWEKIEDKTMLDRDDVSGTAATLLRRDLDREVYAIWDDGALPVLRAPLRVVLNNLKQVRAVSFDTWIFSPDGGFVIEFYHEGEVMLGRRSTSP